MCVGPYIVVITELLLLLLLLLLFTFRTLVAKKISFFFQKFPNNAPDVRMYPAFVRSAPPIFGPSLTRIQTCLQILLRLSNMKFHIKKFSGSHFHVYLILPNIPGCWQVLSPSRKETSSEHVMGARDFNNIETRSVIKFPPPPTRKVRRRRKFTPFWHKH